MIRPMGSQHALRFELCVACHVLEILQGEGDFPIRFTTSADWIWMFPMVVWQENIVAPASTLIISNASEVLSHHSLQKIQNKN